MNSKIKKIFHGNKTDLLLIITSSLASTISSIFIITAGRIFIDRLLTDLNIEWYYPFVHLFLLLSFTKAIAGCIKSKCIHKIIPEPSDSMPDNFSIPIIIDSLMTVFYFIVMANCNVVLASVAFGSASINLLIIRFIIKKLYVIHCFIKRKVRSYLLISKIITVFINMIILGTSFYLSIYDKFTYSMIFAFQGFFYFINIPVFNIFNSICNLSLENKGDKIE